MPIDPSDESVDDEPTAALPVLVETVVLGAGEVVDARGQLEDTAERTANFTALTADSTTEIEALQADLAARGAKIAELEQDIGRLSARWNDVEQHRTARDSRIEELTRTLHELRQRLAERETEDQRQAAKLRERAAEVARLTADNDALRAAVETAHARIEALSVRSAESASTAEGISLAELRDELATLIVYINNRNEWWRELKTRAAAAEDRVRALERELRETAKARRTAEALASREISRAAAMRADLVTATRLAEEQRREIARARQQDGRKAASEPGADPAPAPASSAPADLASIDQRLDSVRRSPVTATSEASPALEVLAALEAEAARTRQQISAQLVELHERDQQLQTGAATTARLRDDIAALRAELDQKRHDVGRLEHALIDKDRALESRDARIGALHDELNQRLGEIQKLNAMDMSLQDPGSQRSDRLRQADPAADPAAPMLEIGRAHV